MLRFCWRNSGSLSVIKPFAFGWRSLVVSMPNRSVVTDPAKRFIRKLMKQYDIPRVMIPDKLRSYGAAKRDLVPGLEHRSHKGLNNCAEVSHKPTRRRERVMGKFKFPRHAQQFLSAQNQINVLFWPHRHRLSAISYRHHRSDAFAIWNNITREIAAC